MPIVIVPGTPHAEEILKWEYDDFSLGGERGRRGPRVYQEFPKMLYKAGRNAQNQIDILEGDKGHILVGDSAEQAQREREGWTFRQEDALLHAERDEREVARVAANRAYHERRMSPGAQAEAAAYDESVPGHVASIPETPIKRRGRPRKVTTNE